MLVAQSRFDDAISELQKLSEPRDAETPRYMFALAAAHIRAGHRDEGRKWAEEARQLALAFGQTELAASIERDLATHKMRFVSVRAPCCWPRRKCHPRAGCRCHRPSADEPLFVDDAAAAGLKFTHVNGASGHYYMAEQMGAGVALFDYDNDGDLDVFLVQGGPLDAGSPAKSPANTSRLFRNDLTVGPNGQRKLHFTDVTERAGVALQAYGMGAAVGDYDNDGYLDLFVTSFGPETLFHNNGNGTFTDVTAQAGVTDPLWSTSAAFIDYDRDGDLDLFVANYLDFTLAGNKECRDSVGSRDYCSPRAYHPVPDRLYRNDGSGRFTNVTETAGISKADGAGLGVATGDYDGDGWLDLYVANDATPNQLWINKHDGTFVDEGLISGAAVNAAGNPEGSMGIASGDFDNDGDEDLFVTNIIGETFAMYVNDGHGNFDDARARTGLAAPTAAFTGFGTDWIDYDNDGWLDLFVTNGAVNVIEALRGDPRPFRMRNQLFRNTGQGRFEDKIIGGGTGVRSRRCRPRRRLRRYRQRRRHRHRRHEQRRGGEPADQPRRVDESLAVAAIVPELREPLRVRRNGRVSSARDGQRCGGAFGPTAAICRPATRASISASARRRPWTRSSSAGRTVRSSDGRASRRIGS